MRREKLYTSCMNKSLLTCSDNFSRSLKVKICMMLLPSVPKCLQHFFISHISRLDKMIKSWFIFLKDALWNALQKLYKQIPIDLFWSFFSYSKWKSNMIVPCPTVIKMFERLFCVAYISAWENDKILIFLLKDAP